MLYARIIEAGRGRGNWGHAGRPGKIGGSQVSGTSGQYRKESSKDAFTKLSMRGSGQYHAGSEPNAYKAIQTGDLGNFGIYGKAYITGVVGKDRQYFSVTKSKKDRFGEPSLSGAIHKSDLKSFTDPDRTWGTVWVEDIA